MHYQERIVVYIDILGFKRIIENTIDENGNEISKKISELTEVFKIVSTNFNFKVKTETVNRTISQFSDLIVISFLHNEIGGIYNTLYAAYAMIIKLVQRGFLCRGAITSGKLIHTSNYLFGPALVDAYILETKAALYPRIILDKSIIELGIKYKNIDSTPELQKYWFERLLKKDSDEMYYIDYFLEATSFWDRYDDGFEYYVSDLYNIITKGLCSNAPDIKIKFSWMKNKYNEMITQLIKFGSINSHGREVFYKSLKFIE